MRNIEKPTNKPFINNEGSELWYDENEQLHRDDGPAASYIRGTQIWYKHGKRHRENGPAIIENNPRVRRLRKVDGDYKPVYRKYRWCLDDIEYTFERYCEKLNLSQEDILILRLKYND